MIDSPCIKLCTLDAPGQVCTGCFRTIEEIGLWTQLTDEARRGVLERLPGRRARYEASHG